MKPYYEDDTLSLHHGDALDVARSLEPRSVQTIVTSPPYFGLRDYGVDGQLGAEHSVQEYVDRLVELFAVLRDVLADDGTLWLNLGDSYATAPGNGRGTTSADGRRAVRHAQQHARVKKDMPSKNLLGVPWRVAFALQADGWILRSDIIWAKPNPMPESVTDRPTRSHEYVFLLSKSPRYYYDAEAIKESDGGRGSGNGFRRPERISLNSIGSDEQWLPGEGRNKRDVWTVSTAPFTESHFAVYPPDLIRPCILASSRPGDTVLDPFSGSGTTGMVATQEGRCYVGIDLNREYLDLSLRTRFAQPILGLEVAP